MDVNELHERFAEYGGNVKRWMRACEALIPEIERLRVWEAKGFENIYEYARLLAGMSRNKVNEALRIWRRTEGMPDLRAAVKNKGMWAVKPVLSIANEENQKYLAEKVESLSAGEVRVLAKAVKDGHVSEELNTLISDGRACAADEMTEINMKVPVELKREMEALKGDGSWVDLLRDLMEAKKRELAQEKPEPVRSESAYIPKAIRDFVLRRSRGRCEFPSCGQPYKEMHHTKRRSQHYCHDPDYIYCLCKEHHHLMHRGLVANEEKEPQFWKLLKEPEYWRDKSHVDLMVQSFRYR